MDWRADVFNEIFEALRAAASSGELDVLQRLLSHPDLVKHEYTAGGALAAMVRAAAPAGHVHVVEWAIAQAEYGSEDTKKGFKNAHLATMYVVRQLAGANQLPIVQRLLAERLLLDERQAYRAAKEALLEAARTGAAETFEWLLYERKFFCELAINICMTRHEALREAAREGHMRIVDALLRESLERDHLQHDADDGYRGELRFASGDYLPLQIAAQEGHRDVTLRLLADPRCSCKEAFNSAFKTATRCGRAGLMSALLTPAQLPVRGLADRLGCSSLVYDSLPRIAQHAWTRRRAVVLARVAALSSSGV